MKTKHLLYGAAYYDEYMPYDRIETDMEMMSRAGMNVIRIAESTWSTWEPAEGVFDFTHLHRMLDAARNHNISVIIGTPTYAIPSWLVQKAPDILALTHGGEALYGHRQNMDITHPVYLTHAEIIIRKLMEEVKDEPHVIGFQLDNETKSYDTCSKYAQAMFVDYLKEQYPDIQEFNQEFGLDYWSNRVDDWANFPDIRGTINQSLAAEYSKFQRKLVTDFLTWQSNIVKEYARPDQFITQNFDYEWHDYSFGLQPEVDQYKAAKCMTVAGCDIYHPSQDELTGCEITVCGNIARSLKRSNYLVLETEAQGMQQWLPYPGQLRLQAYSHLANGANMVEYWHWHSIHNAIESYWKGVLSHDLKENDTYRECARIGKEWQRLSPSIVNLTKTNKIALMVDNASLTALTNFPTETLGAYSYNTILRRFADALFYLNIEYDIIPADEALLYKYDCIIIPALYSAQEKLLTAIDNYIALGGNVIMSFKSAFADEHIKIYHDKMPHRLTNAFGIHYDQFTYPKNVTVTYKEESCAASEWMELITCDTATPIANYTHHTWNKYTAIAKNTYGDGHTLYIATLLEENVLIPLLCDFLSKEAHICEPQKIQLSAAYPVVIKQGVNEAGHHIVYLLNYSNDFQAAINAEIPATELITGEIIPAGEALTIGPWDLLILSYAI